MVASHGGRSGDYARCPVVEDATFATIARPATSGSPLRTSIAEAIERLSCGTFFGHGGVASGIHSIAIVNDDGTARVVIAINLRGDVDPNLLAPAESLLCDVR